VVWLGAIAAMEWMLTGTLTLCTQTNSALTATGKEKWEKFVQHAFLPSSSIVPVQIPIKTFDVSCSAPAMASVLKSLLDIVNVLLTLCS
jgi:hypothetical protein